MREKQRKLLLELRSSLVGKLHTQPFTIYNDNTIEALLEVQPQSLEELATVKGFPKDGKRIKGFGDAVVRIFTDCDRIEAICVNSSSDGSLSVGVKLEELKAF